MTFSTILGVRDILCSFRLVLDEKTGKNIHESPGLEFLETFLASKFAWLDAEGNLSSFVENTIGNLPKVQRAKFLGSD